MKRQNLLHTVLMGSFILASAAAFAGENDEQKSSGKLAGFGNNNWAINSQFRCIPTESYSWKDGKIVRSDYVPLHDKHANELSLGVGNDGSAQLSGGSYDEDGTWNEPYRVDKVAVNELQLIQPVANAESTVVRLIRNSKTQYKFIRYGGEVPFFESGNCTQDSSQ